MENKEYYIDLLESRIINYNPYWEDPIVNSQLHNNTKDAVEKLKLYFNLLKSLSNLIKKELGETHKELLYDNYPNIVKETIKSIIDIVNDGRDLWHPITMSSDKTRKYDHHININGRLHFENDPWSNLDCYHFLENL